MQSKISRYNHQVKYLDFENFYRDGKFNIRLWRRILSSIIATIDVNQVGMEVISPFGFEVMQDDRFLRSALRRFYCYIGIPRESGILKQEIYHKFERKLFEVLSSQFHHFYNDIVLKVIADQFIKLRSTSYVCSQSDKLIDIQCRYVDISILDDYADYIICSLSSILDGTDEPKDFKNNSRFRNRTYQLYVMLERVFGSYATPMSELQKKLFSWVCKRIHNDIVYFYDDNLLYLLADEMDHIALNTLIIPRISDIMNCITKQDDIVEIKSRSYHVNDNLKISISKNIYDIAKQYIITTYRDYI